MAKARAGQPRAAILALTVFAFLLQSFVTQTHIHNDFLIAPATGSTQAALPDQDGTKHQPTAPDDEKHCPFCQEMVHAGAYLTPAPAVFVLPSYSVIAGPVAYVARAYVDVASHFWRGRGPPQA